MTHRRRSHPHPCTPCSAAQTHACAAMRVTVALALTLLAACLAPAALGFEGLPQMPGIPGSDKPKVYANKKDLKYIRCQVCELLAKNAYKQVKRMRKEATPSKPVRAGRALGGAERVGATCSGASKRPCGSLHATASTGSWHVSQAAVRSIARPYTQPQHRADPLPAALRCASAGEHPQVTERAVIEMVEKLSKPLKDEGEWIMKIDLVEEGTKLVAKEMDEVGFGRRRGGPLWEGKGGVFHFFFKGVREDAGIVVGGQMLRRGCVWHAACAQVRALLCSQRTNQTSALQAQSWKLPPVAKSVAKRNTAGRSAAVRPASMLTPLSTLLPMQLGECGVECKTVERAAQDILDEHDTDMGEVLYVVSCRLCGQR